MTCYAILHHFAQTGAGACNMNRGRRISLLDSPPSEDGAKHHTAQRAEARQSRRISATDILGPDPMTNPSVREDPTFIGTQRSSHPKQEIARDL